MGDRLLERMRSGFPLSLRLFREIHEVLLSKGRGSGKQPGEFRRSQNWIGGSRPGNAVFVPPPPDLLNECLSQFELFLHNEQTGLAKSLSHMINLGILEETTGRERHRLSIYRRYLDILNEGTEPIQ
jgi:Fic family protein